MMWSGALREVIFLSSYSLFFISICCLIMIFLVRAISVRIYRKESNSGTDFSRLSRIGNSLTVEHEVAFTVVGLLLYCISFISALIMNSSSFYITVPYEFYINLMYVTPILILTGLFLFWFYFSKPFKARTKAGRISWGAWLCRDKYEFMRFEIQKLLCKLDATNEKVSDVSYRTLELVLQNRGENGCAARAALMDLDPYIWSDYQESLCDRSRSYSYSMVLALCGIIFLTSGIIPTSVGVAYIGDYYLFSIVASSIVFTIAATSFIFEDRRERIKDNFTPRICYETSVDRKWWRRNAKPRL